MTMWIKVAVAVLATITAIFLLLLYQINQSLTSVRGAAQSAQGSLAQVSKGLDALKGDVKDAVRSIEGTVQKVSDAQAKKSSPSSDAGKAGQAADATARAADEAYRSGGSVDEVVDAADVVMRAREIVGDAAGAQAAQAVANAARTRRGRGDGNPEEVAKAARIWADAIKAADGGSSGTGASSGPSTSSPSWLNLPDLPPASATAAFRSALPIASDPAMSAAGDYEYSLFATRGPAPPGQGFDLRLMFWGDGRGVPISEKSSVVIGTDNNGLLHIRIFDAAGNRIKDTDETQLPAQAAAIAALKQRLPGLLPPHTLTQDEKAQVIAEAASIVEQGRRVAFFAIKYDTPGGAWPAERAAHRAAWTAARAVRSQLVSLADPGSSTSVRLAKNESLVIGFCSFVEGGQEWDESAYDWVTFQRDDASPKRWRAFTLVHGEPWRPTPDYTIEWSLADSVEKLPRTGRNRVVLAEVINIKLLGVPGVLGVTPGVLGVPPGVLGIPSVLGRALHIKVIHVRIFNRIGRIIVDTDEESVPPDDAEYIPRLKDVLGRPRKLKREEMDWLLPRIAYIIHYAVPLNDRVKDATLDWFTDHGVLLGQNARFLEYYLENTLLHDHEDMPLVTSPLAPTGSPPVAETSPPPPAPSVPLEQEIPPIAPVPLGSAAALRAVISGDTITFSIEVGNDVFDSYRLAGNYVSPLLQSANNLPDSPSALPGGEKLQYGAVHLRSAAPPTREVFARAADFGADVLRRRGESLADPNMLRTERLWDNKHLVLFVRDPRNGKTSWLGIPSRGEVMTNLTSGDRKAQCRLLEPPSLPSPCVAPPKLAGTEPVLAYPMFVGGESGSRLVEVWLIQKPCTDGRFAASPVPLFDVQYLFRPLR